jgi:hypothetical protein
MTVEELEEENRALMAQRAEAEAPLKAKQGEIARELNRRAVQARLQAALEGVPAEDRAAALAAMEA